jgi:phosphatidylethanolamine-binding protein (PEBP) family uncharacterized protein
VLLVGAVLLAGCGGGGDSSSSESTASTESHSSASAEKQAREAGSDSKGEQAHGGADGQGSAANTGSAAGGNQSQGSGQSAHSGKHGQPIVLPKAGAEPEPAPTPAERAEATIASITLTSPSLGAPGEAGTFSLPAKYTCDGADTWPTLKWSGVPAGAKELILLVLAQEPINGALFYDWGVAAIDPATTEIQSGRLPTGTVVAKNSFGKTGYSICPPQGKTETHLFQLYAVPESLPAAKGFDPAAMRKRILQASGNVGLLAVTAG